MVRLEYAKWEERDVHIIVSIPYGAIRIITTLNKNRKVHWFQFLMVRLEFKALSDSTGIKLVSIPYGAIRIGYKSR